MSITTTSGGFALVPANMREAMDLATMMSKGRLVPQALQDKPADCLLVIEQATRWGMSPFAVAQEVSVISGKLMHSGKIVAAAIHGSGILQGRLRYAFAGEGDALSVTVTGTLRGDSEPQTVTVRLRDAKTNNQHWAKSPEQMLSYHAARVWARRYAPEVMLGVYSPEEFDEPQAAPRDVPATVVQPGGMLDHLRQQQGHPPAEAQQEEALPLWRMDGRLQQVTRSPKGTPAIVVWCKLCEYDIGKAESPAALREWQRTNEPYFASVAAAGDGEASFADDVDRVRDLIEQAIMSPVAPEPQEA